jgi:hypothetical protein
MAKEWGVCEVSTKGPVRSLYTVSISMKVHGPE